ncbi:MAG: carbohydrate ABC transporter permease [Microbacteriaceae bacterium]|nr:carbohydrate ABC transporter permease [Microbacteriaceae bacterium]
MSVVRRRFRPRKLAAGAGSNLVFLLLIALVAFPLLWMLVSSIKPATELFQSPPTFQVENPTVEWYRNLIERSNAPVMFLNSLVIALATMAINMVIASLAAFGLSRFRFRGRSAVMFTALGGYVLPPIVLLIPLYQMISSLGLLDTRIGAIIPHTLLTLPFSLWLLTSFFDAIPRELDEAAYMDGASHLTVFGRIVLPLAAPGVLSIGLLAFMVSWSEYLFSSVILTGRDNKTLPVGIAEFVTGFDVRWGEIMALGVVTTVPIIAFFALVQKYFVAGIMGSGLKG